MNQVLRRRLTCLQRAGLGLGTAGLVACGFGGVPNARQFFISYLAGYTFWIGLSLGCLGLTMLHHLTGGRWGFVTQRLLEAGFMTLPMMAVLFIPLLLGLPELYPWARPDTAAAREVLQRHDYLNAPGFCLRTLLYFTTWLTLALLLRKWSLQQDAIAEPAPTVRLRTLSGPGLALYPLTATFAFVDWVMSVEPHWVSTIFPLIILTGHILTTVAFAIVVLAWLGSQPPFRDAVHRQLFLDLGNFLLAFVVFWTYVSFSQFLIIYSGNLPREIEWYLHRMAGGWKWMAGSLALFHFFVPLFLLLFRAMKQHVGRLAVIATLILVSHVVEVYWVVQPGFFPGGWHVHWLDLAAMVGLGGVWLSVFAVNLKRHGLLPKNDPRLEFSVAQPAHAK